MSNFERVLIPLLVVLAVAATTAAAAAAAEDSRLPLPLKRADADRNKGDEEALIIPILHFELVSSMILLALLHARTSAFRVVSPVLAGAGPVVPPEVVKPAYVGRIKSAAAATATTNAR